MTKDNKFNSDTTVQLIAFKLGDEEFAVPVMTVQEIIIPEKLTKMPSTPKFVEGVINLRGKIIPIIDGRKRFDFNSTEQTQESRTIVLELESHTIGLIVDSVSEVLHLPTKDIEEIPENIQNKNDFLDGVGKLDGRILILLDPIKLLNTNEIINIKEISNITESLAEV